MADSIFVPDDDGFTVRGAVPPAPGLYPGVSFEYRPATNAVRFEYSSATGPDRPRTACRIVSRQIKELRVEGDDQPIKLTVEQAGKLHAGLFQALFDFVMGYCGPAADAEKN